MPGEYLSKLFQDYYNEKQEIIIQDELIQDVEIHEPQFLQSEEVFEDILPVVESNQFGGLSYVGGQGNGKTFSAGEFASHAKKIGFLIIYGKFEDVMIDLPLWKEKVKERIIKHGNKRICFVLDDMSYSSGMVSAKKSATWKNFIGDIRHQFENVLGEGVKPFIFLVLLSHRYHSLPPIMRNSMAWIFASMNSEDRQDAQKLIPKNKEELEKLDNLYKFFLNVSSTGPKLAKEGKAIQFNFSGKRMDFLWGTEDNPGNGRLMIIYHKGEMKLFNPRKIDEMINLEDYRIKYVPPTQEELEKSIADKKKEFEDKAREISEKLNIKQNLSSPITSIVPVRNIEK